MSEHVLVLGGGMELPELLRTLGRDVRTSVLCQLPVLPKLRNPTGHESVTGLPAEAPTVHWLRVAQQLHEDDPFTRIAAFAERDQDRAAAIGEALGLRMHSVQTITWVHHKPSMRSRLAELGVDDTPFAMAENAAQVRAFVDRYGLPCILKPAVGAGSIGITRLDHVADVDAAIERAAAEGEWTRGGALIEGFHDGIQLSVEAFSEGGQHEVVCCTRKYSDNEHFVEVGHVLPAPLDATVHADVVQFVGRVLDALGVEFGPTHTEVVLTDGGPRVIESHVRLGGDRLPYLVADALGVDLTRLTARQILGETGLLDEIRAALTRASAAPPRHEAIWYATTRTAGVLAAVEELDTAWVTMGLGEVQIDVTPGGRVEPLTSSDSRLGYARAHGGTAAEAVQRARDAVRALRLTVVLDLDGDGSGGPLSVG